ncbi:MAG TPA: CPBP family intramembrane glutamic endopeptidase [Actinomycetota bacterium]|nr:CPBP family intramembrane glutamic endopeptidase [Actinomycetota bacterium]
MSFSAPPSAPPPPPLQIAVPEQKPVRAAKAILVLMVYGASQILAGIAVLMVYGATRGLDSVQTMGDIDPVLFLVAGAAGFVVGGPAVFWVTRALEPGHNTADELRPFGWVKARPAVIAASAAVGAVLALVLGYGVDIVFPPKDDVQGPLIEAASAPGWQRIVFVILAIVLAPVVEEFLFRGVLFTGMSRSWGKWPAAVIVTIMFGLLHLADIAGYWPALGVITMVGAAMLAARIRTGSLVPPIAMHAAYNAVQVIVLYLTV